MTHDGAVLGDGDSAKSMAPDPGDAGVLKGGPAPELSPRSGIRHGKQAVATRGRGVLPQLPFGDRVELMLWFTQGPGDVRQFMMLKLAPPRRSAGDARRPGGARREGEGVGDPKDKVKPGFVPRTGGGRRRARAAGGERARSGRQPKMRTRRLAGRKQRRSSQAARVRRG